MTNASSWDMREHGPTIKTFLDTCCGEFHEKPDVRKRILWAFMKRIDRAGGRTGIACEIAAVMERTLREYECRVPEDFFRSKLTRESDGCTTAWVERFRGAARELGVHSKAEEEGTMLRLAATLEKRYILKEIGYWLLASMKTSYRPEPSIVRREMREEVARIHAGAVREETSGLDAVEAFALREFHVADAKLFTFLTNIPVLMQGSMIVEPFSEDDLLAAGFLTEEERRNA